MRWYPGIVGYMLLRKLNKHFPARMTAKERERIIIELLEIIILALNLVAWMFAKISALVFLVMGI